MSERLTDKERERILDAPPLAFPGSHYVGKLLRLYDERGEDLDAARKVLRARAMAIEPSVYAALHRALHGREQ